MKRRLLVAVVAVALSTAAAAYDLGKRRAAKPQFDFVSKLGMFDIERCVLEVDVVERPVVYRQPDRPKEEWIDWGLAIMLQMEQVDGGTHVRANFPMPGGRKARRPIMECAGLPGQ